ncbi:diguanylate cyclase [Desulfovibrio inopinatus]|uniref:diguanylate cyclase n=1 Tax=Desulfovibrio inopinatus TaxID=102109 RepID=UPI0004211609|nr:diguanylate cyclase [Desulfovibrio inopinatus]
MNIETTTARILLVDDQTANLTSLAGILKPLQVEVDTARSGPEALAKLLRAEYALVFLDVQMPEMDGFEVAELMRGSMKTRDIPIIFVTALNTEQKYVFRGYETGAVDYLFKPLEPIIVRSKANVFLQLAEKNRQLAAKNRELDKIVGELTETRDALRVANRQLADMALRDGLTGLANRRRFDQVLSGEWTRAIRDGSELSLAMIDIDYFKLYNDAYGHQQGDVCLRRVARALENALKRSTDLLARYGGEEFVAIMPLTDREGARAIGEALRFQVEDMGLVHRMSLIADVVTVSIGLTTIRPQSLSIASADATYVGQAPARFVATADSALYQAKENGRNRVVILDSRMEEV